MLIPLNKEQYDPFIDYLKGIGILFVVLTHCIPKQDYILFSLWGAQAVPLFLLIQVFHTYKKGKILSSQYYSLKKIFHRILFPFILLVLIQIVLTAIISNNKILSILKSVIIAGGMGPGSYYVWIYLQFFVLLPIVLFLINQIKLKYVPVCFIVLSIFIEVICCYVDIPSWLYRLLFIRYFFLIYLGYLWTINGGILINKKTTLLSFVSIVFILLFQYTDINMEPIFYVNDWKIYHWICYFYVSYLFVYILYFCYRKISFLNCNKIICLMGKYSYEIFLMQMFVFTFYPTNHLQMLLGDIYLATLIRIVATTLLSIIPVLLYKKYLFIK